MYKRLQLIDHYLAFVPAEYHTDPLYEPPSKEERKKEADDQKERKRIKDERKKKSIKAAPTRQNDSEGPIAASNAAAEDPTRLAQDL